jgi:hypothetical protein
MGYTRIYKDIFLGRNPSLIPDGMPLQERHTFLVENIIVEAFYERRKSNCLFYT